MYGTGSHNIYLYSLMLVKLLYTLSLYYLLYYDTVMVIGALTVTAPTHTPHIVNGANVERNTRYIRVQL